MQKIHFMKSRELNQVAMLHTLIGLITIPINLIIASSLAQAVSSVTGSTQELFLYHTGLFVGFSLIYFLISIFKKSFLVRLESKALQAYRQSLYRRFMQQTFCTYKAEPNRFTTLFRRDAAHICRFYSNTLPTFGIAVIGFIV